MAGTTIGGKKAAITNKAKHGTDFYVKIGSNGGKAKVPKGFGSYQICRDSVCKLDVILGEEHKRAQCAGYKGGLISRRIK